MGPYLALPVLKSYLQEVEQYKVDIVDLNVDFYDDLLSFRHVEECCKRYRESKDSFSSNVQLTIELIQKSALNVDEAKDIFRSKRYFNLKIFLKYMLLARVGLSVNWEVALAS